LTIASPGSAQEVQDGSVDGTRIVALLLSLKVATVREQ
jgi:hypothetical protein